MTRFEQDYYNDVSSIEKSLKRIADALENSNVQNRPKERVNIDDLIKYQKEKHDEQIASNKVDTENEELDTQHDYLHQLVQNLDNNAYQEFCNTHCLRMNDAVEVSNYITDLDYDEVLGIIKEVNKLQAKSDDQANEDAIESQNDYPNGVTYDDDYDLRVTAKMYTSELEAGNFRYKKDCILDYVTNEFGSQGARYTDIIKFAYYLNNPNSPKFGYDNRGYYSCAMTHNRWGFGHLVTGGKDHFVKGINKEGNERYFALSFVESVTDYWKYCDNTKKDSNNPDYNYM